MLKRSSVRIAKERLEAMVVSDRVHCKPEEYMLICRELQKTLSKYMEIREEDFKVSITRSSIHIYFTGEKH